MLLFTISISHNYVVYNILYTVIYLIFIYIKVFNVAMYFATLAQGHIILEYDFNFVIIIINNIYDGLVNGSIRVCIVYNVHDVMFTDKIL